MEEKLHLPEAVREQFLQAMVEDALGRLAPERLSALADKLLDLGHCSRAVLELWEARAPCSWHDLRPLWILVLNEIGLSPLSPRQAGRIACERLIRLIARRELSPWDGGRALMELYYDLPDLDGECTREVYDIGGLLGTFWEWKDMEGALCDGRWVPVCRGSPLHFDKLMVEEAERWVREHGGGDG